MRRRQWLKIALMVPVFLAVLVAINIALVHSLFITGLIALIFALAGVSINSKVPAYQFYLGTQSTYGRSAVPFGLFSFSLLISALILMIVAIIPLMPLLTS